MTGLPHEPSDSSSAGTACEDGQHRLITVAIADYTEHPEWKVPEAAACAAEIASALRRFGVATEDWSARAADASQSITDGFGELKTTPVDRSQILYWVGHGESSDQGYFAALPDAVAVSHTDRTVTVEVFHDLLNVRAINVAGSPAWTLLMLDTCGSAEGAWAIMRRFRQVPPTNIGVVASGEGAAFTGVFPRVFTGVMGSFKGNDIAGVKLLEVMHRLEDHLRRRGIGFVIQTFTDDAKLPPPVGEPSGIQATVDAYTELVSVMAGAPSQVRNHFFAKAQGAEISEPAWLFTRRVRERRRVAAWLRGAPQGLFVVTGLAGSGKSALVGMLLATSDADATAAIERVTGQPIPDNIRPPGPFDVAVHLSGRTIGETVDILFDSLGSTRGWLGRPLTAEPTDITVDRTDTTVDHSHDAQGSPDVLAEHLRARRGGGRVTILADALDEARDPSTIATLLRRLAGIDGVRILVGTRQSLTEDPDHPTPTNRALLDLLGAADDATLTLQNDPDAIVEYATSRLRRGALPLKMARDLAQEIAEYKQPFLFARLACYELLATPALLAEPTARADLLTRGHAGIFDRARSRIKAADTGAEALLHALAYARGNGFPRSDGIWAVAGTALHEHDAPALDDVDIDNALALAAPYIMQDTEFGMTTYRLAHRTFTDAYHRDDTR